MAQPRAFDYCRNAITHASEGNHPMTTHHTTGSDPKETGGVAGLSSLCSSPPPLPPLQAGRKGVAAGRVRSILDARRPTERGLVRLTLSVWVLNTTVHLNSLSYRYIVISRDFFSFCDFRATLKSPFSTFLSTFIQFLDSWGLTGVESMFQATV